MCLLCQILRVGLGCLRLALSLLEGEHPCSVEAACGGRLLLSDRGEREHTWVATSLAFALSQCHGAGTGCGVTPVLSFGGSLSLGEDQ